MPLLFSIKSRSGENRPITFLDAGAIGSFRDAEYQQHCRYYQLCDDGNGSTPACLRL